MLHWLSHQLMYTTTVTAGGKFSNPSISSPADFKGQIIAQNCSTYAQKYTICQTMAAEQKCQHTCEHYRLTW